VGTRTGRLGPFALVPALCALAPLQEPERIELRPAPGAVVTTTWTRTVEIDPAGGRVRLLERAPVPAGVAANGARDARSRTLRDRYVDVAGGRPTRVEREVVAAEGEPTDLPTRATIVWDPEERRYRAQPLPRAPGEPLQDDALLDALASVLHLAELLPQGPVVAGASWSVDPDALRRALVPSFDGRAADAGIGLSLAGAAEGEVRATYEGEREEDGVRCAAVRLAVALALVPTPDELRALGFALGGPEPAIAARTTLAGEGRLLWDQEAHVARSLELELALETTVTLAGKDPDTNEPVEVLVASWPGTLRLALTSR
jgi:hypothetical protein